MPIRFNWRPVPLLATTLAIALGCALGQWQMRRAAEKEAIAARWSARAAADPVALGTTPIAPEQIEFRRVRVSGEFVHAWPLYLDNRPYRGSAGFYLLQPFRIAGSNRHILVARGWLPRNSAERTRLAPHATPAGSVEIHGIVRRSPARLLQLGSPAPLQPNAIVQNLELSELSRASQLALLPFMLEQTDSIAPPENLVRDWPRPSSGIDKHRGYAFQWYALAAMALVFYVATGLRNETRPAH